jgi:23S rRNA (uracil1939-C5)-methyltransferase
MQQAAAIVSAISSGARNQAGFIKLTVRVINALYSPRRMQPKCKVFGICNGCQTQHVPYEVQLKNKAATLKRLFGIEPAVFRSEPYGYRNRIDFLVASGKICMRKRSGLVEIERCEIADERINRLMGMGPVLCSAGLKSVVVRAGIETSVSFGFKGDFYDSLVKEYAATVAAENVMVARLEEDTVSADCYPVKGSLFLHEEILGKKLYFHSQGFFQNNTSVAGSMVGFVRDALSGLDGDLIDLYGGVGTFGLCLADRYRSCHIVESDHLGIDGARRNIEVNSVKNAFAHCIPAVRLPDLKLRNPIVIADPPRSGMDDKTRKALLTMQPQAIAYVSCNPAETAKSIKAFKGYRLEKLALFDMFPQTNHMEAILVLRH